VQKKRTSESFCKIEEMTAKGFGRVHPPLGADCQERGLSVTPSQNEKFRSIKEPQRRGGEAKAMEQTGGERKRTSKGGKKRRRRDCAAIPQKPQHTTEKKVLEEDPGGGRGGREMRLNAGRRLANPVNAFGGGSVPFLFPERTKKGREDSCQATKKEGGQTRERDIPPKEEGQTTQFGAGRDRSFRFGKGGSERTTAVRPHGKKTAELLRSGRKGVGR